MQPIQDYFWPYLLSQLFSITMLWTAIKKPEAARFLFCLLFLSAGAFNFITAIRTPEVYLIYSQLSISIYAHFINGWFKDHITQVVAIIAIGQAITGLGMLLKNEWFKFACAGSIIFFLAISPLGVGAAFPLPLTLAVATFLMMKKTGNAQMIVEM